MAPVSDKPMDTGLFALPALPGLPVRACYMSACRSCWSCNGIYLSNQRRREIGGFGMPASTGEARLAALGYKQELKRDFNLFTNTAISFSIISCTSGVVGEGHGLSA